MRFIPVIAALLAVAVAGCASSPTPPADQKVAASPAATDAPKQVCHRELPTGSNIPVTVCEAAMSEAERQQQNANIQNQIRSQIQPKAAGGG